MKRVLSTVAISALLSTGAVAGELYGSIGAALTTVGSLDSGVSVVAMGGMKMDQVTPGFAVEVEVSQTVSDPSDSYSGYGSSAEWELSILGVGAYAVYHFVIPDTKITVKPRLGLNYQSWSYDYSSSSIYGGYGASADATDTSLSFGLGGNYAINDKMQVYVDYTDKGDSENLGAGLQMSF